MRKPRKPRMTREERQALDNEALSECIVATATEEEPVPIREDAPEPRPPRRPEGAVRPSEDHDVSKQHNPAGWADNLGREPDEDETAWLKGFFVSYNGNLTRQGFLTDETMGISLPFRVNVFRRRDNPPAEQWAYGVVLNPPAQGKKGDPKDQDYSDKNYPDPFTASLAVRTDLQKGGFVISKEPLLVSNLRHRFRQYARQQRDEP